MNLAVRPQAMRNRYPLEQRETGPGFASRLAAVNGRAMGEMFRHMGIRPFAVDSGDEASIRFIAGLGDVDAERLIACTPKTMEGKRHYRVAGDTLGVLGINRTFFRFCPACVAEDMDRYGGPAHSRPWLRLEWTVRHYRACHRHNVLLVTAEPTRRRFQPFDFSETMGAIIPDLERTAAQALPAPQSRFDTWITKRLDGVRNPDNWLDTMPLYVAAEWCEDFGVSMLHPSKVATSRLTERQWGDAAEAAFEVSSAGPEAIGAALQRMTDAERGTRGIIGPRDTYGYGYHVLEKTIDDPEREPIRKIVREHALTALPWEIGTDVLGVKLERAALATVRTAAVDAGAGANTIRKIFEKKGLDAEGIKRGVRNHRILAPADEVATLVRKLKGALTLPETMELLGVDRRQIVALVDAGALPYASGTERDFNGQNRFAREDIDAMMTRLLEGAVEVETPERRQVDIPTARHMAGATTAEVLKLIFAGRLRWKGRLVGRNDYMGLLLDADEVTDLVRADAPQFRNFRFRDVATVVPGLTERSVQPLIDLGVLVETMEFSPNARREVRVVTAESVGAFRMKYVTAGELCQVHGLHHKQVKYRLLADGVEPVFNQGAVNAMIYDRLVVEQTMGRN